ncbi:MAG: hypothetical protein ACLRTQ_08405 [Candidatus Borkfalkia sp.]
MQFGVQLYSLRELIGQKGLKEALRLVSAAGFSGVEFAGFYGYGAEQLQELLERYHLSKPRTWSLGDGGGDPRRKTIGCAIVPVIPFWERRRSRMRRHAEVECCCGKAA